MCWACELARGDIEQHKTRWHYLDPSGGIVCVDLNPKGRKLRLLHVPLKHSEEANTGTRRWARHILTVIAKEFYPNLKVVKYDLDDHSYKAHWHAQACLEE